MLHGFVEVRGEDGAWHRAPLDWPHGSIGDPDRVRLVFSVSV